MSSEASSTSSAIQATPQGSPSAGDSDTRSHSEYSSGPDQGNIPPTAENNSEVTGEPETQKTRDDKDARLASRFRELAKRDKRIREEKKRLEAERQQLARWREADKLAKEDPLRLLESMGLTYEQLTEQQFQKFADEAGLKDPERRIQSLEDRIRERAEREERQRQEAQRRQVDEQLAQFQRQIVEQIDAEPERFELVIAGRAHDDVYRLIEAHFAETREVMTIAQAALLVEQQLEEEAAPLLKARKLREKLQSSEQRESGTRDERPSGDSRRKNETERSQVDGRETEKRVPGSTTLTNTATAAGTSGMPKAALDIEESKRRAAAMLKWT